MGSPTQMETQSTVGVETAGSETTKGLALREDVGSNQIGIKTTQLQAMMHAKKADGGGPAKAFKETRATVKTNLPMKEAAATTENTR